MTAPPPALAGPPTVDAIPAWRASRAALLVLAARALSAAVGVVVAGALSRQLGPDGFGELSVVFAVAVAAQSLTDFGATQLAVGEMAARPERRPDVAAGLAGLRLVAGLALAATGTGLLLAVGGGGQSTGAVLAIMATVPLGAVTGLVALAHARMRPHVGAVLSLGQSSLWLVAVLGLGAAGAPLGGYGVAFLGCGLVQAAGAWWTVVRHETVDWGRWRSAARQLLSRSWPLGAAALLVAVYYRLDSLFVYHFRGAAEAGFYAAAYRFLDVLQLLPAAVAAVLVPLLARLWTLDPHGERGERVLGLALTLAAVTAAPVAFGALVAGRRVAAVVYGSGFERSGDVLSVLGLAFFSIATGYVYAGTLIAIGRVRVLGLVAGLGAVATVAADLAVVPRWGAVGAAWVTVGTEYLVSTSLALWIHYRQRLAFPWGRVARSLVAGAAMAGSAWPLRSLPLVGVCSFAAVVYVTLAFALGALTLSDLRALTDRRRGLGG